MNRFSISDILFFFYIYGFLGWIYESILVSVKSKRLANRGFIKGPVLPIYGFGATIILVATKPFENYPIAVFFVGMAAATILEYVTGYILELLFKVRYWDYTGKFGSIKGYICLISVVVWGFFSDIMVYFIHEPVEKLRAYIPNNILYVILTIMSIIFIIDTAVAFKNAYDIKSLILKAEEIKADINEIEQRLKLDEKREEFIAQIEKSRLEIKNNIAVLTKRRNKLRKYHPRLEISRKYKKSIEDLKKKLND